MSELALKFREVTRRFGRKTAVDRLDLEVAPGTVLGLVGRNGAGKTTSLRLALGTIWPDEGDVRVLGLDPVEQSLEVRTRVGLLSEETSLYPWMTVEEILEFGASIHPRWDGQLAATLRKRLDLDPRDLVRDLSRGTRAKVSLVLGVACRPELLLLDDPTSGLDPLVRREILEGVIEAVPAEGGAVVYASHLIQDVERVADRVAFIDEGCLRLEGALEDLKEQVRRVTAVFDDGARDGTPFTGSLGSTAEGRVLTVVARGSEDELMAEARRVGARDVEIHPVSLEEIVIACLRQDSTNEVEHV